MRRVDEGNSGRQTRWAGAQVQDALSLTRVPPTPPNQAQGPPDDRRNAVVSSVPVAVARARKSRINAAWYDRGMRRPS